MHVPFNCALMKLKLHFVDAGLIINPEERLATRLWQDSRQKADRIDQNYKTTRCKYETMRLFKRAKYAKEAPTHSLIKCPRNVRSNPDLSEYRYSPKVIKLSSISCSVIPSLYTSGIPSSVVEMVLSDTLEAARGRHNGCSIKLVR